MELLVTHPTETEFLETVIKTKPKTEHELFKDIFRLEDKNLANIFDILCAFIIKKTGGAKQLDSVRYLGGNLYFYN